MFYTTNANIKIFTSNKVQCLMKCQLRYLEIGYGIMEPTVSSLGSVKELC